MKNTIATATQITPVAQVVEIGKASALILGNGNKRQEHNRTPQITNIEKCAS